MPAMPTDVVSYMLLAVIGVRLLVDRGLRHWTIALRRILLLVIVSACCIPIVTSENLVVLALVIPALLLVDFLILLFSHESELGRTWSTAATVAFVMIAFTSAPLSAGFNAETLRVADAAFAGNALAALVKGQTLRGSSLVIAGMLLSSFELHYPILWTIKHLDIAPPATPAEIARGRTIGYLERPIVFLLIITGNVVSLGLVFAAKTLTRFAKLNNRAFAEYYLIGTLLSFATTAGVALLFSLLKGA
jgi:hypothetical protein